MSRWLAAVLFVALGAGAVILENSRWAEPWRRPAREWLGANALEGGPRTVTAIVCPVEGGLLPSLDAALVLRAVERFQPAGLAFLDPIAADSNAQFLISKAAECRFPIILTGSRGAELPSVEAVATAAVATADGMELPGRKRGVASSAAEPDGFFVAGSHAGRAVASTPLLLLLSAPPQSLQRVEGAVPGTLRSAELLAPVDARGFTKGNPLARGFTRSIGLDDLMLEIERSERGEISSRLDELFRGRLVVAGSMAGTAAAGTAALANRLAETTRPGVMAVLGILLLGTIPWWQGRRFERPLWGVGMAAVWLLMGLAVYQQFRTVAPIAVGPLFILLAFVPIATRRRSNEPEQRELPAENRLAGSA